MLFQDYLSDFPSPEPVPTPESDEIFKKRKRLVEESFKRLTEDEQSLILQKRRKTAEIWKLRDRMIHYFQTHITNLVTAHVQLKAIVDEKNTQITELKTRVSKLEPPSDPKSGTAERV
jgi:hypothetical protein